MDSHEVQLNLKEIDDDSIFWIGVVYVNHRIRAKLAYMLNVEPEYALGLKPMTKNLDQLDQDEEEKDPKGVSKKASKKSKQNEYSFKQESSDEEEEGQITIPKDVVNKIQDLKQDQFYLICYLREKTQNEMVLEQQQLRHQFTFEEDGDKSVKMTPKASVMKLFETQGINIQECQQKAKKSRGDKRVLICPFVNCLKDFTETGNLKTHLRTHTGERPFVCGTPGCNKQFITKGHLKTHELIHSGDKPFICDVCNKSYSRSGRLKIHIRTHTGEKPFRCNIPGCGKTFTEKGNLKTHMRIHSGEKPFSCSVDGCGKTFTTQGHLTDHMRRHSGERPFKCTFCPQSFMRSSTLKIHLRRHTGERPYECQECGKRFSESGNLKTHMKTHVNKKRKLNIKKQQQQNETHKQKEVLVSPIKTQQNTATTLGKRKRLALKHISEDNLVKSSTLGVKRKKSNLELQKLRPKDAKIDSDQEPQVKQTQKQVKIEKQSQQAAQEVIKKQSKQESNSSLQPPQAQTNTQQQTQAPSLQVQPSENESITLPLENTFMPNQIIPEQSQSPQVFQPQQAFNPPLFTPRLNGMQGASPLSFTPITSTNASFNFPTSLSGFQRENPSMSGSKSKKDPTAKHSFQNFFASLQQNQNFNSAFNNQLNNQLNQSNNNMILNNSSLNNSASNQKPSSPSNRQMMYISNNNIPLGPMSPQGGNVEPFAGMFSPNSKRNNPFSTNPSQISSAQTGTQNQQQQSQQQQSQLQAQINSLPSFGSQTSQFTLQQQLSTQQQQHQQQQSEQIQQLPTMNQITQGQTTQNQQKQHIPNKHMGSLSTFQHIPGMQELVNTTKNFQSPTMNPFPQPSFHISSNNLAQLNLGGFNLPRSNPTSKQNSNNNLLPFSIPLNKINHPNQDKFQQPPKMKQSCDQLGGLFENYNNSSFPNISLNYAKLGNGAIFGNAQVNGGGDITNTFKDIQLNTSINGMMLGATPHASTNNLNLFMGAPYKIFDQDQQNASLLLSSTPIHHVLQQQTSQNQQQFLQQQNQNQLLSLTQQQQNPFQSLTQSQQQQQAPLTLQTNPSILQLHQQQQSNNNQEGGSTIQSANNKIEEESFSSVVSKVTFQKSDSQKNQELQNVSSVIHHLKYQQQHPQQ